MSMKPPISTHILDTTKGQPAAGVNVTVLFFAFKLTDFERSIHIDGLNHNFKGITIQTC